MAHIEESRTSKARGLRSPEQVAPAVAVVECVSCKAALPSVAAVEEERSERVFRQES